MVSNSLSTNSTAPVVYSQLYTSLEKTLEKSPPSPVNAPEFLCKSVPSDMLDHLIAGYETSGNAIAYAMYELGMHPDFQTALHAELQSLTPPLIFPLSSGPSALSASLYTPKSLRQSSTP
jgi:unspecific monooxygenase